MHYRLYGVLATALASAAAFAQTTSLHRVAGFGGDTTSASILNGGAAFGTSMRVVNGSMKGQRAYIATALGTSEVGTLSTSSTGQGSSAVQFFNGTIATGVYQVYPGTGGTPLRAFRYVAGSHTSEDLGDFGLQGSSLSPTTTLINAVRGSEIIGAMSKHTSAANLGLRAFRSYSDGSLVDLGTLGNSSTGVGSSTAHVFSNDGSTVYGVSTKYVSNVNQGSKAFYAVAGEQMRELVTPNAGLSIFGRVRVLANGKIAATSTSGRLLVWAGNNTSALEQTIGTNAAITHTDSASNMYIMTRPTTSQYSAWVVGNQSLTPLRIGSSTSSVRVAAVGNAAGRVVGESVNTPQQTVAFRFSLLNGYEELGHLGATSSGLTYSSAKLELDNGLVVGDSRLGNFGMRGFYWESGVGMQSIGTLGTTSAGFGFSTISGKLNFNQVYGQSDLYVNGVGQGRRAIVWSKFAGLRYVGDLFSADDSAGWVFTLITGASADGWVTGYGVKDGIRQAYRFQMQFMTPEPSTMIGLAVGGLALLRRKRK